MMWQFYQKMVPKVNLDCVYDLNAESIELFAKLKLNDIALRMAEIQSEIDPDGSEETMMGYSRA
jgi:hypothetical protein